MSTPFSGTHDIVAPVSTTTGRIWLHSSKYAMSRQDWLFIDPTYDRFDDTDAGASLNDPDSGGPNAFPCKMGMGQAVDQTSLRKHQHRTLDFEPMGSAGSHLSEV